MTKITLAITSRVAIGLAEISISQIQKISRFSSPGFGSPSKSYSSRAQNSHFTRTTNK
jgi:hypothetical protein